MRAERDALARERVEYVRFQGTRRHAAGHFPGIFALVNGLARDGRLTVSQEAFRRANNDWYDAAYPNPSDVDPSLYDRERNPGAAAWFKRTSRELIARTIGYREILTCHGVAWEELRTTTPGVILYEDAYQVLATPYPCEQGR